MKKWFKGCRLVVLCLLCLCLLGGCMPDYSDGSGEHYAYEVQWLYQGEGETAPDEYYIRTDSKIYCFAVSTGELLPIMEYPGYRPMSDNDEEDSRITEYVVREDAVWFATEDGHGRDRMSNKLWKYDRETEACELFLEAENDIWRLGEHEGWLFYGDRDIYACPVDGKPGEDSFNLWEQRGEILRDDDARPYMRTSEFQDWYMGMENSSGLVFVQDKESGEPLLPIDDYYMAQGFGAGCCVNGELIFFPRYGTLHAYRRDDGQGSRLIQCLEDSQYDAAGITGRHVVAEDGKIIVLLQVTRNDWSWLTPDQDELNNDVLFEIDLATNTDRLIYGTKDKNTRIVGYRRGALYLLEDDVIYRESLEGGDRERIYDLRDSKVELYNRLGEHKDVKLTMWGDYLIVQGYSVEEITGIPLENREDYVISKADR